MIYLASPYTDPDPFIREARYLAAAKKCSEMLRDKQWVYSPIVHCHELAKIVGGLSTDFDFWCDYNFHMLQLADELLVLQLDGWASSKGVGAEVQFATQLQKIIRYVKP